MGQWGIPLGVSAIELRYWPQRNTVEQNKLGTFLGIGLLDYLSTVYGLITWGAGRLLPLGTGYQLPKDGAGLIAPVFVLSIILTFIPERLFLWAIDELRDIWGAPMDLV